MQNYHKHTSYSNIFIADSAASLKEYAKRAVELGHKVISSVEHYWQGYYYEAYELAKEYDLKFIFGAEAGWVKDRTSNDRTRCHIILLARNENGRRAINDILSEANLTGYYYVPRIDIDLLLSLPPKDVFVTSACIAFWKYDDADDIVLKLYNHFKDNFMLEVQYHNTEKQAQLNKHILELSEQYGIKMIAGLDSHYILESDAWKREDILTAKGIHYEDEDGWYMDYPDDKTVMDRFLAQNVLTREQIQEAMDNTDILLTFDDIILNDDIKLPSAYPDKTQDEKNKIYSRLITKQFKEYMKAIPQSEYQTYFEGVKHEVDVYKNTGMVDYPMLDYKIVQRAIEKGGVITATGRGSGVSFFTNTLCGFSKLDRFKSPVKLYPERFMSETRILQTRSLPDLDLNVSDPEIFAEAQNEVLTEIYGTPGHAYPMIAFGTAKKKSAFKLYARAQNMNFDLANEISKQIDAYEEAYKIADDDEKDDINIYDYVDEQYHQYITNSQEYWGIIMDKKKAPCGYLLYAGDIRKEIGLIKCKSESTKKEYITAVIDGAIAEHYKFLKNDLLKVDVVLLIDKIYKRIGIKQHTVNELDDIVRDNQKVWDIYAKGLTIGVNQIEKASTAKKMMKYKATNVSELCAFIAAIRPGFKSMYSTFERREHFEYGIAAIDKLIQTPQFPESFILYQEMQMSILNYAGFPMDECYGIIKAIAKKHPEKVKPLKSKFVDGIKNRIIEEEHMTETEAKEKSLQIWQIISDSCRYSFNASHSLSMAYDSLYCAYLKAYYPYEFYEVLLEEFSGKGKKDKVSTLKAEMLKGFNIREGEYKFGLDNRRFVADPENGVINPSLVSIKNLSQNLAENLYDFAQGNTFDNYYSLWKALKEAKIISFDQLEILIQLDYFKDFGSIVKIEKFMNAVKELYGRASFKKANLPIEYEEIIAKYSKETDKTYSKFNYDSALKEIWKTIPNNKTPLSTRISYENVRLGYIKSTMPKLSDNYYAISDINMKYANKTITAYRLNNGELITMKIKAKVFDANPLNQYDIIKTLDISEEPKWGKTPEGEWYRKEETELILKKWANVR